MDEVVLEIIGRNSESNLQYTGIHNWIPNHVSSTHLNGSTDANSSGRHNEFNTREVSKCYCAIKRKADSSMGTIQPVSSKYHNGIDNVVYLNHGLLKTYLTSEAD